MIVRKYGRRSRDLTSSYSGANSLSDVVSDSPSQDFSQDVYNLTLSSQDSARCQWSDPCGFNSEKRQLKILPARKSGLRDDCDEGFWKEDSVIAIGDSDIHGSSSSQELREVKISSSGDGIFEICDLDFRKSKKDLDFRKSKKAKKVNSDPFGFDSSPELEDLKNLPPRKIWNHRAFEFSDKEFESDKTEKVDSDSYGFNSVHEVSELGCSSTKYGDNNISLEFEGVSRKPNKKEHRGNVRSIKKKDTNKRKSKLKVSESVYPCPTTTLMETQEFGEMMESMDEVNFALDGLKKGQQITVRRASLLSLLSICGSAQQRRLLRVQGVTKIIIDAVLGLSFDDPSSNLAAAALFYVLTSEGQDDRILESPNCIQFLIKLLKPLISSTARENAPSIGSKLLGICKNTGLLQNSANGSNSSSAAIMLKVQEILIFCKEIKPRDDCDTGTENPELNPKWISLLTMEKACLSAISIEDGSGEAQKTGGKFKEKLREFGGLNVVFEEARKCYFVMEEWLKQSPTFALDSKEILGVESLVLLLKCLKIMENATFLSKDNQCHLLGIKGKFDGRQAPRSFIKLILGFIKILSGVSLLRSPSSSSHDEKLSDISNRSIHSGCSMEMIASQKSSKVSQCNKSLHSGLRESSKSSLMYPDPLLLKMRVESSITGSCSMSSRNTSSKETNQKRQVICDSVGDINDSQDPFAFDEDDLGPSKWELVAGRLIPSFSQESKATEGGFKYGNDPQLICSQQESCDAEKCLNQDTSCSSTVEETSTVLTDCLLTSVKVLMNLTNDNPEGCQQIANSGGLEILSSLISGHFSAFTFSLLNSDDSRETSSSNKLSSKTDHQSNSNLSDQQLDFLVAILGLLVNLVEKDSGNRARLAAVSVSIPSLNGFNEESWDVIYLLSSIFLANQGAGEATGEGKHLSWEDEDSILQGEKEAEKMIVEAYSALLLAFLSTESKNIRNSIAKYLPKKNLTILVPVLERFVEFHQSLNMISPETHTIVLEVIESCRIP